MYFPNIWPKKEITYIIFKWKKKSLIFFKRCPSSFCHSLFRTIDFCQIRTIKVIQEKNSAKLLNNFYFISDNIYIHFRNLRKYTTQKKRKIIINHITQKITILYFSLFLSIIVKFISMEFILLFISFWNYTL